MTNSGKPGDADRPERQTAPRDVPDPRYPKNGKHGKTTAGKWNQ